jgi:hypothetical protein
MTSRLVGIGLLSLVVLAGCEKGGLSTEPVGTSDIEASIASDAAGQQTPVLERWA